MTDVLDVKSMSRVRLAQLMERMRSRVSQDTPGEEMPGLDWTRPHHFAPEAWFLLQGLGKKTAGSVQRTLQMLCHDDYQVKHVRLGQFFASSLAEEIVKEQAHHFLVPYQTQADGDVGFIRVSSETATVLISQMLRDPDAEIGQDGVFSSLEESILQDVLFSVIDAVTVSFNELNVPELVKREQVYRGEWPLSFGELEDMLAFYLQASCPAGEIELTFYVKSEMLDPFVGQQSIGQNVSQNQVQQMILEQMREAPVTVTAQLAEVPIALNDLMTLEAGDVLILGKKVTEPIELLLNGEYGLNAWPATCGEKCAVVVAEPDAE